MTVTSDVHTPRSKTKSLREMRPAKPVQADSSLGHYSVVLRVEQKTAILHREDPSQFLVSKETNNTDVIIFFVCLKAI